MSVRARCGGLVEDAVRGVSCSAGMHDGDIEVVDVAGHVRKWRVDCEFCGETTENWGGVEVPPLSQLVAVAVLAYVTMPVYVAFGGELDWVSPDYRTPA